MKNKYSLILVLLFGITSCYSTQKEKLPNGYKIWKMNSQETFISDINDTLIVGPSVVKIGVVNEYIIAFSDTPNPEWIGKNPTIGYSIVNTISHDYQTNLTKDSINIQLKNLNQSFPNMKSIDHYEIVK